MKILQHKPSGDCVSLELIERIHREAVAAISIPASAIPPYRPLTTAEEYRLRERAEVERRWREYKAGQNIRG